MKKRSLRKKISIMTIALAVFAVVLFLLIIFLRLSSMRTMIRENGEQASEDIQYRSGLESVSEKSDLEQNQLQKNAAGLDDRITGLKSVLFVLQAEIRSAYYEKGKPEELYLGPPRKDDAGELTIQLLTPDGAQSADGVSKKLRYLNRVTTVMYDLMYSDSESIDRLTMALPDGQSVILDRSPEKKLDESGNPLPYDARKEEWYRKVVAEETMYVTATDALALNGEAAMLISVPVYSYEGDETICVLNMAVNTKKLLDLLKREAATEGHYPILLDPEGRIVCSLVKEGPLSGDNAFKTKLTDSDNELIREATADALAGGDGMGTVEIDGTEYLLVYTPVRDAGWAEIELIEEKVFESSVEELINEINSLTENMIESSDDSFVTTLIWMIVVSVVLIFLSILLSLIISGKITRPIKRMTGKVAEIDGEHILFEMEESFRTGDEIETLAETFDTMSRQIQKYITDIVEVTSQKERMETELNVATGIQAAMLPKNFPLFPERDEFDVFASMDPAKEVGGDFYDIFLVDDDHLALVMGDVSGKGVPASLFMVISKTLIKTRTLAGGKPGEILEDVNNRLMEGNEKEMFVTVWLAILTISTGEIISANAGHEDPAIRKNTGEYVYEQVKHGVVVGAMEDMHYRDHTFSLEPGELLFIYTDGVPEAQGADGELFGEDRTLEALNRHTELAPTELLPAVRDEVDAFVGDSPQFDDLTMLAIEYKGGTQG